MYISSIAISGFRNLDSVRIDFQEGVNVVIGHNNAGKTNLLKSIALILDASGSKKLDVDDFNKNVDLRTLQATPPKVSITMTISESDSEAVTSDDLVTVSNWLIALQSPYQAQLTYECFLPESETAEYINKLSGATSKKEAWNIIKHEFLRKYVNKIYGGAPQFKVIADSESISKFDFQFLNAIRDVERDMFTGRNTLLREIVDFFLDYEIKNDQGKTNAQKLTELKVLKSNFSVNANKLLQELQKRMKDGEGHILNYAKATGASMNNESEPVFDGEISEAELYSTLRLIIKYTTGIEVPATHNGLGYNNLIYMSLLLAKMQVDTNGNYLGSNAKVYPILIIEEPEAHLHPSMQYKFLKFLKENVKNKARQVFITSHSTHITSAVSLDEIICLSTLEGNLHVGYPGKAFTDDAAGKNSKAYVQRFLDATRSDMLFAKSVILVEGLAEQLLMSVFAKYHVKPLEDGHVSVINIGGRYFDHFIKLFDTTNANTIWKKIACVTDRDPSRKELTPGSNGKKCYPFEVDLDPASYVYQENAAANLATYAAHSNIRFFSQDLKMGKTLEYDLVLKNPSCRMLLTESVGNKAELEKIMTAISASQNYATFIAGGAIRVSTESTRIKDGLNRQIGSWTNEEIMHSLLASRYLNSVEKGENALELSIALDMNLDEDTPELFWVPQYIKESIDWVWQ